ncbi:glycosyltransferase 87 family protein [Acidisphaera rubrifaciens]|nr:glycosyltransferase 87 family protein [Acidisphaera rubrifaciens]
MRRPLYRLGSLGAALLTLTVLALLLDIPASFDTARTVRVAILVGLLALSSGLYFAAVRLVLRHTWPRGTVWVVLGVAVALRGLLLIQPPILSSDIFRYVWDGRVQAAGINPYRYVPADPALAALRDRAIYPRINRATYARTIYPPVAELVFAAVGRMSDSVTAMRLMMLGFEAVGVVCLLHLLSLAGLPRERVLVYAWNPLVLWSFASDGHVDAVAVGLLGLALLLRARHRDGWAGAALAGAVLVKLFPLVAVPAFIRGGRFWRLTLAGLAVIVCGYALYSSAGWHVLGFLPSYGREEGIDSGQGVWLLAGLARLLPLPREAAAVYAGGVVLIFLCVAVAILRRRPIENDAEALCRDTGLLAAVAMAAISPHYHWYFAWLALPAVVAPSRALIWLATAPILLIKEPVPGDRFFWPSLVYVPAILLLLADLRPWRAIRFRRGPQHGERPCPLRRS